MATSNKHASTLAAHASKPSVSDMGLGSAAKRPGVSLKGNESSFGPASLAGFEISKLKQKHKCDPGGHCSVYMSI